MSNGLWNFAWIIYFQLWKDSCWQLLENKSTTPVSDPQSSCLPPPHRLIKTMYTVVTLHRFVALSKSMMPLAHFPTVRLRTGAVIPKKLWMAERTVSCLITLKTWQNLAWIRIRNREFLPTGFVCEVLTDTVLNVTPTKRPVSKRQVYKTSGLQNTTTQPSLCLQTWLQQNLRIFKNQKYWIYMDVILQP